MRIAFANDHAALEQREALMSHLRARGHEVLDCGAATAESVDYPDFAHAASRAVEAGQAQRAVYICGSGIGMSIAANRHPAIRCALAVDRFSAEMGRRHNDANGLALRARGTDAATNCALIDLWLDTEFEGGRHQRRVDKVSIPGDTPMALTGSTEPLQKAE